MSIAHDVIENAQRSSTAAFSPNAPELKALFCSQQESWGELRAEISTQEEEKEGWSQKVLMKPGRGSWERGLMPPMCSRVIACTTSMSRRYLQLKCLYSCNLSLLSEYILLRNIPTYWWYGFGLWQAREEDKQLRRTHGHGGLSWSQGRHCKTIEMLEWPRKSESDIGNECESKKSQEGTLNMKRKLKLKGQMI